MRLCDELLTIVVIVLVNRFVHGRVPTAVPLIFFVFVCFVALRPSQQLWSLRDSQFT